MPTVRSDIVIRLGSSESDARSDRRAIDDATPFVAWSLPSDIQQVRFSVRLASAEPNGWAFTTSGVRNTPDQQFDFPSGIGLNDNFSGLCKLEVSVSSSASGDMQWVSEPYWFVYDRHLERFFQADQLRFEWSATDDPDGLPVNGIHHYWLQIAHDPLFNDVVYDNTAIVEPVATRVRYTATAFVPAMGRHYFYRVAMHDGLEWGEWSIVHAFVNLERQPPSVTIDSVTHTGNLLGDIDITLTVSGADDHYVWVELMYRIGGGEKHPPSLLDSLLYLPDGTHRVTWRSFRNLQRQHVDGVMLHAIPYDESSAGDEVAYGPFAIDNSYIPIEGGGFGSATVGFAVRAGHVGVRTLGDLEGERDLPVKGNMVAVPDPATYGQIEAAVRGGKLARFLGFVMGTAEKRPGSGQTLPGINPPTAAPDGGLEAMPTLMRYPLGDVPMSGSEPAMEIIETERANPHADATAFMFSSPVHYANNEDAWPRPMQTRDMGKTSFLWGYLDPAGNEVPYPDGYDFDHRPSWHVGREVWRHDDAWVQVGAFLPVDAGACGVCSGRNWVPAGPSGNYRRDPCPNADCVNGFDMSNPLWLEPAIVDGQAVGPSGSYFAYYLDVQWHHLSTWVNNTGGFGRLDRNGPGASIRIPAYEMRDADESFWPAAGHTGKTHQLAGTVNEGAGVDGGSILGDTTYDPGKPLAIDGYIRSGSDRFSWGYDPASHPAHAIRPLSTQPDGVTIRGGIGRDRTLHPLEFRFMQRWWDAYNTIHFRYTGSETSKIQMQVSRWIDSANRTDWSDVRGDNAKLDHHTGKWLIDPFVFHAYWSTASRQLYLGGFDYQLRIRAYDTISRTFSDWVTSPRFLIQSGVTNPVSVLATKYDPWSKWIHVKFRVDDSEQDKYTITNLWYSKDDGGTWQSIAMGTVSGQTAGLSSRLGENEHTLIWDTSSYGLTAAAQARLRIEAIPTGALQNIAVPYFRWLSSANPSADPAQWRMHQILGRYERMQWDESAEAWQILDPPVYRPGLLSLYDRDLERVKRTGTQVAPSGYYTFHVDDELVDAEGYDVWLGTLYDGNETHGSAMSRLSSAMDLMVRGELPQVRNTIWHAEQACRYSLIDQGFYAEQWFEPTASGYIEALTTKAVGTVDDDGTTVDVTRFWEFRVQSVAAAPSGAYVDGFFSPGDATSMERVFYKIQIDPLNTFSSQPRGRPMRDFRYNDRGQRLSVSEYAAPATIVPENGNLDTDSSGQPWDGQVSDTDLRGTDEQFAASNPRADTGVPVGGILKVPPAWLPGEDENDVLPPGREDFSGDYHARVAAYNAFQHNVTARPRPTITGVTAEGGILQVQYASRAHDQITHMTIGHYVTDVQVKHPNGYLISTSTRTPEWVDTTAINYVSDRRGQMDDSASTINRMPWVPAGRNRPRPCVYYDDDLMQYVMASSKVNFRNQWRITTARAMAQPVACEVESLFDGYAVSAIYGPSMIKVDGVIYLYVTVQQTPSSPPRLAVSTSTDGRSFSTPNVIQGIPTGAYPTVLWENDTFKMWFESLDTDDSVVKIYAAESANGTTFTPVAGVAYSRPGDIGSPSVARMNGGLVMFFNDTASNSIASVYHNGTAWAGFQTELPQATVDIDGTPTSVIPRHPCVYWDLHMGNPELFMLFNYLTPGGEHRVHITRLEGRVWVAGEADHILGGDGHLFDVPTSPTGVARQCSINMSPNGIVPGGTVKVRLNFNSWSPGTIEYHRQSEWVNAGNAASLGAVIDPTVWRYDLQLKNFPYMELST